MLSFTMRGSYTAVRTSSEDDQEEKPLVCGSPESALGTVGLVTRIPSRRWTIALYCLCALSVGFAIANLAAVVHMTWDNGGNRVDIRELPRPDVFAGLPGPPPTIVDTTAHGGHNHTHEHAH
ncbi:hypothetical protein OH77DRAFT_24038 [Trametes cingulata]|nr:hypothetical protein OH77DRAFT_24038 [Trametes cingulata]